jgi:hypothetical protein
VASRLGWGYHFFELKPDWLLGLANEAVRLTDGLGNVVNLHALAGIEEHARYAEVVFKGFLGDAMFGIALARPMWGDYGNARHDVHIAVHREHGYDLCDRSAFTDPFLKHVGNTLIESYGAAMDRCGVSQLGNQRLYFDLTQRAQRLTLQGVEVVRSRAIVRLPFCDNDLLDFALTVPPGLLLDRHLSKAVFVRRFPEWAARSPTAPATSTCSGSASSRGTCAAPGWAG